MKIFYISPSRIPSNTANSIHVINQVKAFQSLNYEIVLFAARSIFKKDFFKKKLLKRYGVKINRLRTIYIPFSRINELIIGLYSILFLIFVKDKYIISRNLFASFILSLFFNGNHIYEIHELFSGYKMYLQDFILKNKKIKFVAISKSLAKKIVEYKKINTNQIKVIHDAAPSDLKVIDKKLKINILSELLFKDYDYLNTYKGICVYTGSLGKGRGIEIIQELSINLKNVLFVIVGGSDAEVNLRLEESKNKNLIFTGFKKYNLSLKIAACADILLMPYQKKVLLGNEERNVSTTMSPLKMFEYMALEVPIISSDLLVLREILKNQYNSILVKPDCLKSWTREIDKLLSDKDLSKKIARNARKQMLKEHTWEVRAKKVISF